MNNFEIEILEFESPEEANDGVNDYISECSNEGIEIIDMTSHVTVGEDNYYVYTFVFKIQQRCKQGRG